MERVTFGLFYFCGKLRYFLRISYFGPAFHGWQIQPNAPSVQQELNEKLSVLLREPIYVVGAGRTDTGVHATGMICHFDTREPIANTTDLLHRLNSFTNQHLAAHALWEVPDDAHARFSATSRSYLYKISTQKSPFAHQRAWTLTGQLVPEVEPMQEAANLLLGERDFASFAKADNQHNTTLCNLLEARWEMAQNELIFHVKANRFLRNMVRAMVGTLVHVGQGKITPQEVLTILEQKDRSQAGESAPAEGLYFVNASYSPALHHV